MEIQARGLKIQLASEPAQEVEYEPEVDPETESEETEFDPEELELVSVHTAWEESEAQTAKRILDEAGIPSYFGPENLEVIDAYKGRTGFSNWR